MMEELKIRKKLDRTIIEHSIKKNEQISIMELDIIQKKEISALLPVAIVRSLFGRKLRFDVYNCIELKSYLKQRISLDEFVSLVLEIVHVVERCESYGIRISNLELSTNLIFYDLTEKKVRMLYWPLISLSDYYDVKEFFKELGEDYVCQPNSTNAKGKEEYFNLFETRKAFNLVRFEKEVEQLLKKKFIEENGSFVEEPPSDKGGGGFEISEGYPDDPEVVTEVMKAPILFRLSGNQRITLSKFPFVIGKSGICDYAVTDNAFVSKKHATITECSGKCMITDNHSTNGVRINGQQIEPDVETTLSNGDQIELGSEKFMYFAFQGR
ncbi:MAG: FHA domain-containing protein [Lachnospiraceae bacterium]|nr:FHA domain-containing protein [Lachnospiraceae bacterium]